jgi:glycosyltransferase involved in cell wall biosynthesis
VAISTRHDTIVNILIIHQNFPGQYKHLAPALAAMPGNRVIGLGEADNLKRLAPGWGGLSQVISYPQPQAASAGTHRYLHGFEAAVRRGQAVARCLLELRKVGFVPEVVCAHPGWGEALYVKDIFPETKMVLFAEFYYRSKGSDVGFDPALPVEVDDLCRLRTRNATQLLTLEAADLLISPTEWQKAQYPSQFAPRIRVIHDGVDTDLLAPTQGASLWISEALTLTPEDEVITYVARNLEPYRGFPSFMRALPRILQERPEAHVVIVGGDGVSYGRPPTAGQSHRQCLLAEVGDRIDSSRVHFLGHLPYQRYLEVLAVSTVHVYLTYPFVLSWSMLEAMACGCLVIGSDTPPVREVIQDGANGLLTDFFDSHLLAERVAEACRRREAMGRIRANARQTVVAGYDLRRICLPQQVELVRTLGAAPGGSTLSAAGLLEI